MAHTEDQVRVSSLPAWPALYRFFHQQLLCRGRDVIFPLQFRTYRMSGLEIRSSEGEEKGGGERRRVYGRRTTAAVTSSG